VRRTLVIALVSCVESPRKGKTRRFLLGLSSCELQFIAEYLGCCILESVEYSDSSRDRLARSVSIPNSEDREHNSILLREFLTLSGIGQIAQRARARQAS
jgi:hypothetical protein